MRITNYLLILMLVAAVAVALLICRMAYAASNPATTGVTQGYVVGTGSVLIASTLQGIRRSQLSIQAGYENPAGSYLCFAVVSPNSGTPATCSTGGADAGGFQLQPGQPIEWPSYRDEPIPQGDVQAICSVANCHVTVLQQ